MPCQSTGEGPGKFVSVRVAHTGDQDQDWFESDVTADSLEQAEEIARDLVAEREDEEETTKESYLSRFATVADAVAFEESALSVGREFLPACAQSALDKGEAGPEYWAWLSGQAETAKKD